MNDYIVSIHYKSNSYIESMEETGRYAMAICKFLAHEKHGVQLANSNIIQQYQKAVIYSNFKPAWLLDIIPLFKLQFLK